MSIVTFYCGDPKNAPKTTQGAHLGGNAILLWQGKLLLERRVDADVWGLPGGGAKKQETARQAVSREIYEELGLRIPEDLSLLGYDNIVYASLPRINLTSISHHKRTLGRMAVNRLIARIEGDTAEYHDILEPELIIRGTCRGIRSSL